MKALREANERPPICQRARLATYLSIFEDHRGLRCGSEEWRMEEPSAPVDVPQ